MVTNGLSKEGIGLDRGTQLVVETQAGQHTVYLHDFLEKRRTDCCSFLSVMAYQKKALVLTEEHSWLWRHRLVNTVYLHDFLEKRSPDCCSFLISQFFWMLFDMVDTNYIFFQAWEINTLVYSLIIIGFTFLMKNQGNCLHGQLMNLF